MKWELRKDVTLCQGSRRQLMWRMRMSAWSSTSQNEMNDIEYIIFDDNHRAIMENGVCATVRLTRTANAMHAKWMMASEKRWLAAVIARAIFEWFFGCLVAQSLCRSLCRRCAVIYSPNPQDKCSQIFLIFITNKQSQSKPLIFFYSSDLLQLKHLGNL